MMLGAFLRGQRAARANPSPDDARPAVPPAGFWEGVVALWVDKGAPAVPGQMRWPSKDYDASAWRLVRADAVPPETPSTHLGRVFVQPAGDVVVIPSNVTVQFRPELSTEAVRAILARHGLVLGRALRFAPNLFTAQAMGVGLKDARRLVSLLQAEPDCLMAEVAYLQLLRS